MVFVISYFVHIVVTTVMTLLSVLDLMMLVRALMSWIAPMSDSRFAEFLYTVTEVVIYPVRVLCDHYGWFEGSPMDMPFMITYLLLIIVQALLPAVAL